MTNIIMLFLFIASPSTIDPADIFLHYPAKGVSHGDRFYFLNQNTRKIEVFNSKEWLHSIGNKGMGPGFFQNLTSFTIFKDQVLTLEQYSGRVQFFNLNGKVQKQIRLKIDNLKLTRLHDIAAYEDFIIISYTGNGGYIDLFDFEGNVVHNFVKKSPYPAGLGIPLNLNLRGHELYVCNVFDGSITVLDLKLFQETRTWQPKGAWNTDEIEEFVAEADDNPNSVTIINRFRNMIFYQEKIFVSASWRMPNEKYRVIALNHKLEPISAEESFIDLRDMGDRVAFFARFGNDLIGVNEEGDIHTKPLSSYAAFQP
jgi:hypothetical protein